MPPARFTIEEKQSMLDEAAQSSYSSVSKKRGVTTAQLFTWRKDLRRGPAVSSPEVDKSPTSNLFEQITHFEGMIAPLVIERLVRDLRTGDISAYNAANAYSALVGSFCRLANLKLEVIDRLPAVAASEADPWAGVSASPEERRKVQQFAEMLLVQLAADPRYADRAAPKEMPRVQAEYALANSEQVEPSPRPCAVG